MEINKDFFDKQTLEKISFIKDYVNSENAASGSKYDANANVDNKNLATMIGEIPKGDFIKINRNLLYTKIKDMFGEELSDKYIYYLNNHFIYKNDETSLANYCASITMYPWLLEGTKIIGGNSLPPSNLMSFCGGFVNLVFIVSSMLSGAVATPEFLMYMDYFIRKEFGDEYYKYSDKVVYFGSKNKTINKIIEDHFQQIVYSINQPTGARNFQSVFWNISYYDKYYFESIFSDFVFPDGSKPIWDSLSWLQVTFLNWFNNERTKCLLTYPVETMSLLSENGDVKDKEYAEITSIMYSKGHSFFTYMSDNVDSLASCCRLRNEINNNGFSYTLGAGGVSTGSKSVLTININRCIQYASKNNIDIYLFLEEIISLSHKVQLAYNENLKWLQENKMLPLFDAGFINIDRQYLTIGVNGIVEAAQFFNIEIKNSEKYCDFVNKILSLIKKYNQEFSTKKIMFNCEMIPAENVGVKHAKWDKEDGYKTFRECYNSYFYIVEDNNVDVIEKFKLHGKKYIQNLTGGSALHCNLSEHLSQKQYRHLLQVAAIEGCNYFTFNIPNTICNDCEHIDKRYLKECPKCKSKNIDYLTRIIGYLKRISSFSIPRQKEAKQRIYNKL